LKEALPLCHYRLPHSYQILSRVLQSPLPHAVRPDPAYRNADLREELKIDEPRFYPRTEAHTPITSLFVINLEFQFLRFAAVFTSCGADYRRFWSVMPIHAFMKGFLDIKTSKLADE